MLTYFVALTFSSVHSGAGFTVVVATVVAFVVATVDSAGLVVSCFLVVVVATVVCSAGFAVVVTAGVVSGATVVVTVGVVETLLCASVAELFAVLSEPETSDVPGAVVEVLLSDEQPTASITADRITAISALRFLILYFSFYFNLSSIILELYHFCHGLSIPGTDLLSNSVINRRVYRCSKKRKLFFYKPGIYFPKSFAIQKNT